MRDQSHKVFLLSLGQLVHSDINKSYSACAKLVNEGDSLIGHALAYPFIKIKMLAPVTETLNKCFTCLATPLVALRANSPLVAALADYLKKGYQFVTYPFAYLFVRSVYLIDIVYFKTIENYKNGQNNNFEVFKSNMCAQLWQRPGSIPDESLKGAWNAMCRISEEVAADLGNVARLQRDYKFPILIISDTNPTQFEYIQQQLRDKHLDFNPIVWRTSYQPPYDKNLARTAISEGNFDRAGMTIISLHNRVKDVATVALLNADFKYHPYNTSRPGAKLASIISEELGIAESAGRQL